MVTRRGARHGLHLFLTIITLGFWSPVWLVVALVGRREVTTTHNAYAFQAAWDHSMYQHQNPPVRHRDAAGNEWNPYTQRWETTPYGGR